MRVPGFKRLQKQDYAQEEQGFIEKLSFVINNSFEVIYEALNNKISLRDNMSCTVREILVEVTAAGIPTRRLTADFSFNTGVEGVVVLSAINTVNPQSYPGAVFVNYSTQARTIIIDSITGLQPATQYRVKLAIFGQ